MNTISQFWKLIFKRINMQHKNSTDKAKKVNKKNKNFDDDWEFKGIELKDLISPIQKLPDDVIKTHILSKLDDKSLGIFKGVNKKYYQLAENELRRRYLQRGFGSNLRSILLEACDTFHHHYLKKKRSDQEAIEVIAHLKNLAENLNGKQHAISLMIISRTILGMEYREFNSFLLSRMAAHHMPATKNKIEAKTIRRDFKHTILSIIYHQIQKMNSQNEKNSLSDQMSNANHALNQLTILIRRSLYKLDGTTLLTQTNKILQNLFLYELLSANSKLSNTISNLYEVTNPPPDNDTPFYYGI